MQRKKVDGQLERKFLAAMILDKTFLATAAGMADPALFPQKYAAQVIGWCRAYFLKHREAPGKNVTSIYQGWVANENPVEEDAEAVHDFLESLSDQYDDESPSFNVPHLLDELAKYLTSRKLANLRDQMTFCLDNGHTDEALAAVTDFRSVKVENVGYDPLNDESALIEAFAAPAENLFELPGAAGRFFNRIFTRESLVGLQAPEKRGKTWWSLEFMVRALQERRKVAVFETGDLTKSQINRRLYVRAAAIPDDPEHIKGVKIPTSLELVDGEDGLEPRVSHVTQSFPEPLDLPTARRALRKFKRRYKIDDDSVRFSVHANRTINVSGIDSILQRWKHEDDFIPDVIIIDHADILAPENPRADFRHQINETWMALSRLRQEWHACVIAPTQADAGSYDVKTQSMKNFSEDKRKYGHLTAMLGLNQTPEEKDLGIMRVNILAAREKEFNPKRCLYVAQCLPLGIAMRLTAFK